MDTLQTFMAYAAAFEQTYVDDDWSRIEPFFAPDAVYEVKSEAFGARLVGPQAICAGMRKSVDGFDRRFDARDVQPVGAPEVAGDALALSWQVTYRKAGVPDFVLRGRSELRVRDGRIVLLRDIYPPATERELAEWRRRSGMDVDASYT